METAFVLKQLGLSETEITVYIELLPLGIVKLQDISKKTGLPRSTTYHTLNYLIAKGLVAKIVKDKITHYTASDPKKFQAELDEKKQLLDSILPELSSLHKSIHNPSSVEIYEGFKGIQTILSDLVSVQQQVYYFGGYTKSLSVLKHLPNYVRQMRIEKKIPAKMVYDYTDEPILHTKEYRKYSELRFLDDFKDFPCMIFIYGDKVSMFSHKTELVGVIIQNKDFSEAMKFFFNMVWEKAKPAKLNKN